MADGEVLVLQLTLLHRLRDWGRHSPESISCDTSSPLQDQPQGLQDRVPDVRFSSLLHVFSATLAQASENKSGTSPIIRVCPNVGQACDRDYASARRTEPGLRCVVVPERMGDSAQRWCRQAGWAVMVLGLLPGRGGQRDGDDGEQTLEGCVLCPGACWNALHRRPHLILFFFFFLI